MHDMQRQQQQQQQQPSLDSTASTASSTATTGTISVPLVHYLLSAMVVVCMILWKVVWSVQCTSKAAQV